MTGERGGGPAPATELPELLAEHLASSARARPPAPPQVWAAVRPGERAIAWRAGEGPYAAETPGPHTMFEIGSNTKTFTALLLADMVVRGEINYTDPIAAFLPGHARPQRNRRRAASAQITLLHLATHTGGLSRLPRNLLARALRDRRTNPYARYTLPDLYAATARLGGGPPPGTRMRYSNYGVGLLGQLLANAAGTDYGTLITQRICRPLGLAETLPHPPPASDGDAPTGSAPDGLQQATGYRLGRALPPWRMDAQAGAGALRSSGHDMVRYLEAQLRPASAGPLAAALAAVQRPWLRLPDSDTLCLVWNSRTVAGQQVIFHSGGTLGCTSFLAFSPGAGTAVVALSGAGPRRAEPLPQQVYDLLLRLNHERGG